MKDISKKLFVIPLFFFALPVYADDPPKITDGTLQRLVDSMLSYIFPLAGLICLIFIIQGGYMWIVSAGNPEQVKKAQGTLTWAIIGLIFVMIIFGLLTVILDFAYSQ